MIRSMYTLVLIFLFGVTKAAGHHFIRLVIMAALGLAGLYMLHNLAQDFQKIYSQFQEGGGVGGGKWLTKRSANSSEYYQVNESSKELPEDAYPDIDWDKILSRDPVGCARSFVCQIVADSRQERQEDVILQYIRYSIARKRSWAHKQLEKAVKHGEESTDPRSCRSHYRFCPYSGKTMMALVKLFGGT